MTGKGKIVFLCLLSALLALAGFLQLRLWSGPWSRSEVVRLQERMRTQRSENEALKQRNAALAADVQDLKEGHEAVEERARAELGMTKPGEVFYQVIEPATSTGDANGGKR